MAADPEIALTTGRVRGRREGATDVYRGIPFAEPPVGALRFRRPRQHPGWGGVLESDRFGDSPVQPASPFTEGLRQSEDCLTANVWSPFAAREPLPVLVWVYGGGFVAGSSAVSLFDGGRLAQEGSAIVVTANHRVGALGFSTLTHRGLPEATGLGVLDVIAVLGWVRREIGAFGGDPNRVTVMGQSSGAFIAAGLLGSPAAEGLFRALVLISGGASRLLPLPLAERLGDELLHAADVRSGTDLLDLQAERIVQAQASVGSSDIGARNGPVPDSLGVVLDGEIVCEHPMSVIDSGAARSIDMLFLVTGAEVRDLRGPDAEFVPANDEAILDEITSWGLARARASEIAETYRDEELGQWRERLLTDFIYRLPAARAALAQNGAGGRAWLSQIDNADGSLGGHSRPTAPLFGVGPEGESRIGSALRRAVLDVVAGRELGWPEFTDPEGETMMFGADAKVARGAFAAVLSTWNGVDRP